MRLSCAQAQRLILQALADGEISDEEYEELKERAYDQAFERAQDGEGMDL